jgi:hypothetical protein
MTDTPSSSSPPPPQQQPPPIQNDKKSKLSPFTLRYIPRRI